MSWQDKPHDQWTNDDLLACALVKMRKGAR